MYLSQWQNKIYLFNFHDALIVPHSVLSDTDAFNLFWLWYHFQYIKKSFQYARGIGNEDEGVCSPHQPGTDYIITFWLLKQCL